MSGGRPVLRVTRRYDAAAERVFDAFLEPAKARRFLFATPGGEMVCADIDARVGGAFRFIDRRDGEDVEHVGEYLEILRPRRLVFTFGVPKYDPTVTRITIEIGAQGEGCMLTLTHEMVPPEWAERTQDGWTKILDTLARTIGVA